MSMAKRSSKLSRIHVRLASADLPGAGQGVEVHGFGACRWVGWVSTQVSSLVVEARHARFSCVPAEASVGGVDRESIEAVLRMEATWR